MRPVIIIAFAFLFLNASGFVLPERNHVSAYGYHKKIGIPKASSLLVRESMRIVGGGPVASITQHPHQSGIIPLLKSGYTSVCGGSLVSSTRVLTAAHCWWDGENQATKFTIVLGSATLFSGGTRVETTQVVVHPNWNVNTVTHDIAIARVPSVTFNNNIQAIPLPTLAEVNLDFVGLTGTISGYGKTSDGQTSIPPTAVLHDTTVNVITNTVCQISFRDVTIHGSHICTGGAGGRGTCDGDSGGPLTVIRNNRRLQVGISSFGPHKCQSGEPSVYTRITAFLNWINANL